MPSFSILDLSKHISAKIIGDEKTIITALASIDRAKRGELTFLKDKHYQRCLAETNASAVILAEADKTKCKATLLIVENPELAFARIAQLFNTQKKPLPGIHKTAVIASTARIDASASIAAQCVIGENVVIGENTIIHPGVIISDDVTIGSDCLIYSRVTLYHEVILKDRVILHSGAVIGADGFGLAQNKGSWEKIPQLGSVIISDDVEIGANTCVDRGALNNTIIEKGVKIDNFVQIAHNVVVGAHTVIAGCSAIAGSTTIGHHCIIAGAVNFGTHLTICPNAVFTGCATVTKSIKEPGIYSSGTGLLPNLEWRKCVVRFRKK
ncbi:MAG: UDP-3-O-(3-hydroxymyristoyl)glucosamine N-acyltransferase [Gammaproteobacteria bacterium RIFCSPHIGHO2_12_FULL_38_11]|nr:MAG: UDP-3-O-(3-hydroxymyristoyl)glucosamine N-acyltransferase [Gammaproteobacteria bacterium RIFCSPHIGHO2_12_FULL_38_11]